MASNFLAGLAGAAQGFQSFLAQRLKEQELARQREQEQAQFDARQALDERRIANEFESNANRDRAAAEQNARLEQQGQETRALAKVNLLTPGMPIEAADPMAEELRKVNLGGLLRRGPSPEQLVSPLSNEALPPYQFAGTFPQLAKQNEDILSPAAVKQKLEIAEEQAKINEQHRAPANPLITYLPSMDEEGNPVYRAVSKRVDAGEEVPMAPTADARNRATATQRAGEVFKSMSELSARINTQQGVVAKITGTAAKAAAQANLNDDVSEYNALIQMFTPLVARAVGHSGVLTEQDVQSVRAGFPSPGDSKSVRDRKVARISKIMIGMNAPPKQDGADPSGATAPPRKRYDLDGNPIK